MNSKAEALVLSVIVCTFNRVDLLPDCLTALVNQDLDKSLFEVIVINNNSTDSTQEVAETFTIHHNFRVVFEYNQGLSHARNRGWLEAKGKYVAFIDDDAKADPHWCKRIVDAFNTVNPTPVVVGGEIHPWYEVHPPNWFCDDFEIRSWGKEKGFLKAPQGAYGFSGSNMTFSKDILIKYGGFSPDFGMVGNKMRMGEETELFIKIFKDYPYFWYDPAIQVKHFVPSKNMKVWYRFKRNFSSGLAGAAITKEKIFINNYLLNWRLFFKEIFLDSIKLLSTKRERKRAFIKRGIIYAARFGYLIGQFSYLEILKKPSRFQNRGD